MPHIYDNITRQILAELRATLTGSRRADVCVGYFNLRGWDSLADWVDAYSGADESCCRVLVGMQRPPEEALRQVYRATQDDGYLDGPTVARLRREAAKSFKEQIEFGVPTAASEAVLRGLARQLRARQVRVKLFLAYPLHAKLYLIHRRDHVTPTVGYLGSSNLTFAGLSGQGELNIDVTDNLAVGELQKWFEDRWHDECAFDISDELAELIETSWARQKLASPYLVYLKMAYYLSEEARLGEREFKMPKAFENVLLDFQAKAVFLAARHLHQRGGVLLGDVVGLGKTLMASAVAKIFQLDDQTRALIICPPKLLPMWKWYVARYELSADLLSLGKVDDLPNTPRYRLLIIDESHNLRNPESARFRHVRDYVDLNEPRVMLLTATPFNKQYADLGSQLRLIVDDTEDLRVRPEKFFQEWARQGFNEADFIARFQAPVRSLRAFEQSDYAEDWQDLLRLYMVRRTRRFIKQNYAQFDAGRDRHFVMLNGQRAYFPKREPKKLTFALNDADPADQYARLYHERVVSIIEDLSLPRYGLANYLIEKAEKGATAADKKILANLNRAGRRLMGFFRTNLFKRLESSGYSFLLSLERYILRNLVTLHALEQGLPVPIGTQTAALLDASVNDADDETIDATDAASPDTGLRLVATAQPLTAKERTEHIETVFLLRSLAVKNGEAEQLPFETDLNRYRARAQAVYDLYRTQYRRRFDWLPAKFFRQDLQDELIADARQALAVMTHAGEWNPQRDAKLQVLHGLLTKDHPTEKTLVFSQFADTALYVAGQLQKMKVTALAAVTSESNDPTALARRFSPISNGGLQAGETPLRILIATDVLSEGQNLQDAHLVVNFDLPWAIIRLIQRAGRVDRIGQQHDAISVYSFIPAAGVEHIINLRKRLEHRLKANQEVVGSDESFFGEDTADKLRDLYTEQAGALDDDEDSEIDLVSTALQVWNSASEADRVAAAKLPPVIPSARALTPDQTRAAEAPGTIAYLRFADRADRADALVRVNDRGELVSQSLGAIFRASACGPDVPPLSALPDDHYPRVATAVALAMQEQQVLGGQLGSLRSTRRKVFEHLKRYREKLQADPNPAAQAKLQRLEPAYHTLFRSPLKDGARESLGRRLRLSVPDADLAETVLRLYEDEALCLPIDDTGPGRQEPQIVLSLTMTQTQ